MSDITFRRFPTPVAFQSFENHALRVARRHSKEAQQINGQVGRIILRSPTFPKLLSLLLLYCYRLNPIDVITTAPANPIRDLHLLAGVKVLILNDVKRLVF